MPPAATRPKFRGLPIRPPHDGLGLLPWTWAEERLAQARSYWLATTRPDGSPHAMPVWGVWIDGAVVFDTHPLSRKAANLERDGRAVIHLESAEETVILEGTVEAHEDLDPELFERYAVAYSAKYGSRPPGGFRFDPRVAYAWDNADFTGSATRFRM